MRRHTYLLSLNRMCKFYYPRGTNILHADAQHLRSTTILEVEGNINGTIVVDEILSFYLSTVRVLCAIRSMPISAIYKYNFILFFYRYISRYIKGA